MGLGVLEVIAEVCKLHPGFETDIRSAIFVVKEAPTGIFEEFVDFDTGGGFFLFHEEH